MTMSGRHPIGSLVVILGLTFVEAFQELNSIKDLKKIGFGDSVPLDSLVLLHWFANTITIDNNNVMRLTFDPNNRNYGIHHYANYERLFDTLPQGSYNSDYTFGNINEMENQISPIALPPYIRRNLYNWMDNEERNRARIIFRARENPDHQARYRVNQVYITQHFETHQGHGTRYDRVHTYHITINLLREIREFAVEGYQINSLAWLREHYGRNIDDSELRQLQNRYANIANLALLLLIVIRGSDGSANPPSSRDQHSYKKRTRADLASNILGISIYPSFQHKNKSQQMSVIVGTGDKGRARIYWSNIPENYLKLDLMVVLFKNNNDSEKSEIYHSIGDHVSGSWNTSISLNNGLQVRLHKVKSQYFFWKTVGEELYRGDEFQNKKAEQLVNIRGYEASLQLFVKDGKACARLYVSRTFTEWGKTFKNSWIGFYSNPAKGTYEYEFWQWQWATKMMRCEDVKDGSNYVYEYHSSMIIAPGVQARFILINENKVIQEEIHTPFWV